MKSVAALLLLGLTAAGAAPAAAAPRTFVIRGQKYFAVSEAELKATGLPRRDIPDERNAALWLLKAAAALPALPTGQEKAFRQAQRGTWPKGDNALEAWLDKCRPALDMIRKAVRLPDCQFPILSRRPAPAVRNNPTFLYSILLPHLRDLRQMARICAAEGRRQEHRGDTRGALEHDLLAVRIGRHVMGDGALITDLVGMACQTVGGREIRRRVLLGGLDAATLGWLATELDGMADEHVGWARALEFESLAAQRVASPDALMMVGDGGPLAGLRDGPLRAFLTSRAARILLPDRAMKAEIAGYFKRMIDAAKLPPWEALKVAASLTPETGSGPRAPGTSSWNVAARMLLPALSSATGKYVEATTLIEGLRVAVALQRYNAAKGAWPAKLSLLAPDFLRSVPPDPFTGQPFRYRLARKGWRLWSVGRDLKDGGGHATQDVTFRCRGKRKGAKR